jgi:hypothetical protein
MGLTRYFALIGREKIQKSENRGFGTGLSVGQV